MNLNILIGLPTHRAQMFTATVFSLTSLVRTLLLANIPYTLVNVDSAEIAAARNSIATLCLNEPRFSHLLFIDDDMGFDGESVLALLRADKDLVGCICPRRQLDLKAVHAAGAEGVDFDRAASRGLSFITPRLGDVAPVIRDEMCELAGIGMGLTLIRRDVFVKLSQNGGAPVRNAAMGRDQFGQDKIWGFFETMVDEARGVMLSEDVSFCTRWREACGGKVFGLTHEKIVHVGRFDFEGRYIDWVNAQS